MQDTELQRQRVFRLVRSVGEQPLRLQEQTRAEDMRDDHTAQVNDETRSPACLIAYPETCHHYCESFLPFFFSVFPCAHGCFRFARHGNTITDSASQGHVQDTTPPYAEREVIFFEITAGIQAARRTSY